MGTGAGSKVVLSDKITSTDPDDQLICNANKNNALVDISSSFAFFKDIKKMATSILDDPPDSATFIAYSIMDPSLTDKANLIRINPCYSPVINNDTKLYEVPVIFKDDPDAVNKLLKLIDLDMDAVDNPEVELIIDLCDKFVTDNINGLPNQLIRGDISTGYLGNKTYTEAKENWKKCI